MLDAAVRGTRGGGEYLLRRASVSNANTAVGQVLYAAADALVMNSSQLVEHTHILLVSVPLWWGYLLHSGSAGKPAASAQPCSHSCKS